MLLQCQHHSMQLAQRGRHCTSLGRQSSSDGRLRRAFAGGVGPAVCLGTAWPNPAGTRCCSSQAAAESSMLHKLYRIAPIPAAQRHWQQPTGSRAAHTAVCVLAGGRGHACPLVFTALLPTICTGVWAPAPRRQRPIAVSSPFCTWTLHMGGALDGRRAGPQAPPLGLLLQAPPPVCFHQAPPPVCFLQLLRGRPHSC